MKSQRRHELKENDLAHAIGVARNYVSEKGKPLGTVVLIALVVIVLVMLAMRSSAAAREDRWRRFSQLRFDPEKMEEAKDSLTQLAALTREASDRTFVLQGLLDRGVQGLRLAHQSGAMPDRELLDHAKNGFEELQRRFPDNPLAVGIARCGLATVEGDLFVLTGDSSHKERAGELLTSVIEDQRLNGLPFQQLALDRRAGLESTFSYIEFAPAQFDAQADVPKSDIPLPSPQQHQTLPPELREKLDELARQQAQEQAVQEQNKQAMKDQQQEVQQDKAGDKKEQPVETDQDDDNDSEGTAGLEEDDSGGDGS